MLTYSSIFLAILPVFGLLILGFGLQRSGRVTVATEVGVMRLGIDVLLPCLILTAIVGNPILNRVSDAWSAIAIGFFITLIGYGVVYLVGVAGRMAKGSGLRSFVVAAGVQNYGFLPIPIIIALFGSDSGVVGLVFVLGVGIEIAMWTAGLAILTKRASLRSLLNAPIVAVFLALVLHYLGLGDRIPAPLLELMSMLGRCAVPLAVLMIGVTMGRSVDEAKVQNWLKVSVLGSFSRLGLLGGMIVAAALFLPISDDLRALLVIQGAMPAAVFPITLARLYGGQTAVAICVVLSTSLVSLATAPFVIKWGLSTADLGYLVKP